MEKEWEEDVMEREDGEKETPNEYDVEDEPEDADESTEEPEDEPAGKPAETPPEKVANAYIAKGTFKEGVTRRHGDIAPVKVRFKPITDRETTEFFESMHRAKNVRQMRRRGYKLLSKHVLWTSMVVDDENTPFPVENDEAWGNVSHEVVEDVMEMVLGEMELPGEVRKNS
jgi:hypothetical protein